MDPAALVALAVAVVFCVGVYTGLLCARSSEARHSRLQLHRRDVDRPALDALDRVGRSHL